MASIWLLDKKIQKLKGLFGKTSNKMVTDDCLGFLKLIVFFTLYFKESVDEAIMLSVKERGAL